MSENFNNSGSQSPLEFHFQLNSIAQDSLDQEQFFQSMSTQRNHTNQQDFGFLNPFSCDSEDIGFNNIQSTSQSFDIENFGLKPEDVAEVRFDGLKTSNVFENDFDLSKFIIESSSSNSFEQTFNSNSTSFSPGGSSSSLAPTFLSPDWGNDFNHSSTGMSVDNLLASFTVSPNEPPSLLPSPLFEGHQSLQEISYPAHLSFNSSGAVQNPFDGLLSNLVSTTQLSQLQSEISLQSLSFDGGGSGIQSFAGGGFNIKSSNSSSCHSSGPSTPEDSFSMLQTPSIGLDQAVGTSTQQLDLIGQLQQELSLIQGGKDQEEKLRNLILGFQNQIASSSSLEIKREESRLPSPCTPSLLPASPFINDFNFDLNLSFTSSHSIEDVVMDDSFSSFVPSKESTSSKVQRKSTDQPTKTRSYQVKSSTSKKALPGFAIPLLIQEFQKAKESGNQEAIRELSTLLSGSRPSSTKGGKSKISLPEGTENALERLETEIEKKRRNNTMSARKSRAKKVELEKSLEVRKKELEKEIEGLKRRCRMAERDLEWRKRGGPGGAR